MWYEYRDVQGVQIPKNVITIFKEQNKLPSKSSWEY